MSRVGLIFGGRSVEHKVSIASARTVARGLAEAGHQVSPLGIGPDGCWNQREVSRQALDGTIDRLPRGGRPITTTLVPLLEAKMDALFPIVHGTWGEDGTLQGLCEMLNVPYVGAGVATSALAMDKVYCKQLLAMHGLPVVDYQIVEGYSFEENPQSMVQRVARLGLPLFVKPAIGGSSVGISKVSHQDELESAIRGALRFADRLLVEKGIIGRELECAVLGYHTLEASKIGEIISGGEFYDYTDKYLDDAAELIAPASVTRDQERALQEMSKAAFTALGGEGMARVDFLLDGDAKIYINEINTHPGFTDISMYPRLWELTEVPLPQLVDRLVAIAIERHDDQQRLDRGIKDWLAELSKR